MAKDAAYYEAEKIIEEALKSGATTLDLSKDFGRRDEVKLSELPDSIGQLRQLTELKLSNNQLTTLPDSIGQLTQLTVLILNDNPLRNLSVLLVNLTQLRALHLGGSKFTTLPELISKLTQLQSLTISNLNLELLPTWIAGLTKLESLNITNNNLTTLPESIGDLTHLVSLDLSYNSLVELPESVGNLNNLRRLYLSNNNLSDLPHGITKLVRLEELILMNSGLNSLPNRLSQLNLKRLLFDGIALNSLPSWISEIISLEELSCTNTGINSIPEWLDKLTSLRSLYLDENALTSLPSSIAQFQKLNYLNLDNNPLDPELAEAYEQGLNAVKLYLRAGPVVRSNEAKLILVGEGEVGKTCLMDALLDKPWQEHPSTHGIEIQSFKVISIEKEKTDHSEETEEAEKAVEKNKKEETPNEITLNGWDFGGQRVYRPTHQLFFSAPAVYLVVWKPREGPQQGFVKEWIQLIKRREPSAKILVVATHGGPQQRQPDIDRQELWDLFGKETVIDFFFVDSKPNENGKRKGIEELKQSIAKIASELPEVGRSVPKSFADVRKVLQEKNVPYLPLDEVIATCRENKMDDEIANLFIRISHRLGHLTHYENDPVLKDIVILRPDWLSTAMSYVLDDEETRNNQGLVKFSRLAQLWNDPLRPEDTRYSKDLHEIFLRLMERFDLSYRVAGLSKDEEKNPVSLIAQLVPDNIPEESKMKKAWGAEITQGDIEQTQICRIVDAQNGQSANAEGLFYQLIVRLHRFSLGRVHWEDSIHWQRGLILDDEYNGRALLRHIGNDLHITVRAAFPEYFLGMLTSEVRYLVDSFWEGLHCDVTVPCLNENPCLGLFEVEKLIENKKRGRPEQPCPICNEWQSIDQLLSNAPAATEQVSLDTLIKEFAQVKDTLSEVNDNTKRILSQVDKQYSDFIKIFTDEAKEGPRLFSFFPVEGNKLNPEIWIRENFRLVLWCEHSRLPLPMLNEGNMQKGVYDLEFEREWFQKAVPYLKFLTGTLSLVLPVASSTLKVVNDTAFKTMENQLSLGKDVIDAIAGTGTAFNEIMGKTDSTSLEHGVGIRAENSTLRELHAMLKAKDPSFGGLVRVMNKRQEFLWVHEKFASEY